MADSCTTQVGARLRVAGCSPSSSSAVSAELRRGAAAHLRCLRRRGEELLVDSSGGGCTVRCRGLLRSLHGMQQRPRELGGLLLVAVSLLSSRRAGAAAAVPAHGYGGGASPAAQAARLWRRSQHVRNI